MISLRLWECSRFSGFSNREKININKKTPALLKFNGTQIERN
jgi:hypothetical protein